MLDNFIKVTCVATPDTLLKPLSAQSGTGLDLDQSDPITRLKQQLREQALYQRSELATEGGYSQQAATYLHQSFISRCPLPAGAVVGGYWPNDEEIDVRPLLHALYESGHPIALPVIANKNTAMRFRRWIPGQQLVPGKFGLPTPPESASDVRPNIVLVPLLAFDREGYRLGRGIGFYDRTLRELRSTGGVMAIGLAYAWQEVPQVPHHAYDQRLDWVVTERYASPCTLASTPNAAFKSVR